MNAEVSRAAAAVTSVYKPGAAPAATLSLALDKTLALDFSDVPCLHSIHGQIANSFPRPLINSPCPIVVV